MFKDLHIPTQSQVNAFKSALIWLMFKGIFSHLRVMMCPLAQKQAKQMPAFICTTSARSTKDVSVMLCLNTQVWEGRDMTLACFSEHTTAYWFSFSSWDVDGDTDTGRLLRTLSRSSPLAGALGSYHGSKAEGRREPVESRKAIRRMLPFNLTRVPVQRGLTCQSQTNQPSN